METGKLYDFAKAKQMIEERIESLQKASLGMHEDWFWTAETVFEDGKFKINLEDKDLEIGGIGGSFWATPTLQLCYKDGSGDMVECFTGEQDISFGDKIEQQIFCTSGVLSAPVQMNITPLSDKPKK